MQAFQKVPALRALAPKQTKRPFVVTQLVAFALFIVMAILAEKRFRSDLQPA